MNGGPPIAVYTSEEIGADPLSWTVRAGSDGRMYFGGDSLLSFDGERWRSDPGGTGYAFRGLDEAPDGRIWAAGNGELG